MKLVLWGPVAAIMGVIFFLSSIYAAPLPPGMSDKGGHGLAYAVLAVAVIRALAGGLPRRVTWRVAVVAFAITLGYGIANEIVQAFVPGRVAEMGDVYADARGAVAALVACWAWGILAIRPAPGSEGP